MKFYTIIIIKLLITLINTHPYDLINKSDLIRYKEKEINYWQVYCETDTKKEETSEEKDEDEDGDERIDDRDKKWIKFYLPESCKNSQKIYQDKNLYKCIINKQIVTVESLKDNKTIEDEDNDLMTKESMIKNFENEDEEDFEFFNGFKIQIDKEICNQLFDLIKEYKVFDPKIKEKFEGNYREIIIVRNNVPMEFNINLSMIKSYMEEMIKSENLKEKKKSRSRLYKNYLYPRK